MLNKVRRWLPHAAIVLCNMYIVFFLIDRVNTAMNFIDNGLTKGLLAIMCVVAVINAWELVKVYWRRELLSRGQRPAARPAAGADRSAAPKRAPGASGSARRAPGGAPRRTSAGSARVRAD